MTTPHPSTLHSTLSPQEKLALEQRIVAALDFDGESSDEDFEDEQRNVTVSTLDPRQRSSPSSSPPRPQPLHHPPSSSPFPTSATDLPLSSNSSIIFEIPNDNGNPSHRPERSDSFLFGAYAGLGMVQVENTNPLDTTQENEDRSVSIHEHSRLHDTSFRTTHSSVNEPTESLTTPLKNPSIQPPVSARSSPSTTDLSLSSLDGPSLSSSTHPSPSSSSSESRTDQQQLLQSSKKVAKYINKHYLRQLIHHQQQTLLHHNYPRLLLPVLERTPEPLTIEQWHLAVASVANDNLAIQHESATDRAAVVLVKGMAENNATAKARITHERNTAALLFRSIPPVSLTTTSKTVTNPSKKSVTSPNLPSTSSPSSSSSPSAKVLKHTALSNSTARSVFSALCPTAAAEIDPIAVKADNAFETFMNRIGKDDPPQIHKLLRRHIFYCCRLHKGDPWLPSTASKETTGGSLQASRVGGTGNRGSTQPSISSSSSTTVIGSSTSSTLRNSQLTQKLSPNNTAGNPNGKSRLRTGSIDIDGILRGTDNLSYQRTAVDIVKDISRVVGNHSLGAKTAAFAELLRLMYADILEIAPKEEDTFHHYLSSDDDENGEVRGIKHPSEENKARVLVPRATVDAVITDIKNYTNLLAKGIVTKYPFLTSLLVARTHHHDLSKSTVANGPPRKDSNASTSSASNMHTIDLSSAVLRCAQEAVYILVHDTLTAIFAAHTVEPDTEAAEAFRYMRHQPPCVYGLSHAFCAPDEPGCTLHGGASVHRPRNGERSTPYGHAAALAEITYRAPIECLHILRKQRSPLTKLGALRTCLNAVTHGALVERTMTMKPSQSLPSSNESGPSILTTPSKEDNHSLTTSMLKVELSPFANNHPRNKNSQSTPLNIRTPSHPPSSSDASSSSSISSASPIVVGPSSPVAIGADDLVPRLCFVVARARIYRFFSELAYLEECMPHDRSLGEDGYAVVTLRGAAMHVLYLAKTLKQTEEKSE